MRSLQSKSQSRSRLRQWSARITPALSACFATLLALPASAGITLPTDPLTTGARIPPNVLLILDDSGSMSNGYMPDDVPTTSGTDISKQTYTRNSIYYNPAVTYKSWVDSTGTARTDGMAYDAVYADAATASGATSSLLGSTQTFYVPKDLTNTTEAYLGNAANYYRYQILAGSGKMYRSVYETYTAANTPKNAGDMGCSTSTNKNTYGWRGCEEAKPTARTVEAEKANYAVWYSYSRTRAKVAKGGAGRAFSALGTNIRVGFRTINKYSPTGAVITEDKPIPVDRNNGLFDDPNGPTNAADNNRTQWFDRLYGVPGTNSTTPLRGALNRAGSYFSSSAATGPYGPETGTNQFSCRQNFTILTTDGYWNESSYTNPVGEQDNVPGSTISGPKNADYTYTPELPYAKGNSYQGQGDLADVAMYYWKNDLRTDLSNIVPTTTADPAFWQHMVTFGISIGEKGTLDPAADLAAITAGTKSWPNTENNKIYNIDDLWHATINGRGDFVVATDPDGFVNGLTSALSAITERTGSFANVAANSTSLTTDTKVFSATYKSGVWTGDLAAYPVVDKVTSATPDWRASIPATNRKVFTSDGTAGLAFPASATQAQLDALLRTGAATNYPVTGAQNAEYIAGSREREMSNSGNLRNRASLLGDIVSSSPYYVTETDTVYVSANDGMLHAFNASSGAELFAYIPNAVNWAGLASLSRPDYTHQYLVDGPVVVSSLAQTPGENILVGALGKGGKGLFALDVTAPASFGTGDFKWEVGSGDADMGLVQGRPFIAKLNNGVTAVIVSNGINSTNGHAVLFVYNLDTGERIAKIDTGVGSAVTDSADSNGLSGPVGWDADGNGTVDYVYAGDMLGNVWKFNLTVSTPASWSVANGGSPIFSATHTAANGTVTRQPITGGLTVAMHPTTYKTWVFVGTGRLLTEGDMSNAAVQSVYGFMDDGTTIVRDGNDANLTQRSLVAIGTSDSGQGIRGFESEAALPAGSKGWYVDLLTPPRGTAEGERVVSDMQMQGTALVFSSVIPLASACDPNGRGYLNVLSAFTGTSTSFFDLNGNGNFADDTVGDDGVPVGSVDLGVGMPTLADLLRGVAIVGGSSGSTGTVPTRDTRNVGRVSWREVKKKD